MSRLLPQSTTSHLQAPEAHISQPIKKRKHEVPRVPQTPVYGDTWDAERDQVPPLTPSVLVTTSMFDRAVDPSESGHPMSEPLVSISEQERRPADLASEQQDPGDIGAGTSDPWHNSTQSQDQNDLQARYTTPPNISTQTPPAPQTRTGTVLSTSHHHLQPIPPWPLPERLQRIPSTLDQLSQTTPGQRLQTASCTHQNRSQTVLPIPSQRGQLISSALGDAQLVSPTQQQPQPVPPISQRQSVPLTFQEQVQPDPSTTDQQTNTIASLYNKITLPTRQDQKINIFDGFVGGDELELRNLTLKQQPAECHSGTGEVGGDSNEEGSKPRGGKEENSSGDNNKNYDIENDSKMSRPDVETDDPVGGQIPADQHDSPMSPASSAISSIAINVTGIKERNKEAIIIRAQIQELTVKIEDLKTEKLKAEGREELDPLSEESTLKELEIQKAERSLERLKKKAERRYQAGE